MLNEDDDSAVRGIAITEGEERRAERPVIRAGFVPLVDCAALVVAARKGFAEAEGLTLDLVRQASWAAIRDRVIFGQVDVAQMLAPMPIASTFGLGSPVVPLVVPMALGLGGNAITVSRTVFDEIGAKGAEIGDGPAALGAALARLVARRAQPLTLAMVHPFSAHNYELRYFLAAAGIDPDRAVRLVVVPPPYMVEALASGQIDGFSVGEPWNSLAVASGAGVLLVPKVELWRSSPCKVLGMRADFAERHPDRVARLVRALEKAARWADDPANRAELAAMLADPSIVGVEAPVIARALSGDVVRVPGGPVVHTERFLTFHAGAATFPWRSHALWFFSQMVRWKQLSWSPEAERTAGAVYRPDLYRAALAGTGAVLPSASAKVEGALSASRPVGTAAGRLDLGPDAFFDGSVFDPDDVRGYLAGLPQFP